jgi:flagellar basal body-associated protein FliL
MFVKPWTKDVHFGQRLCLNVGMPPQQPNGGYNPPPPDGQNGGYPPPGNNLPPGPPGSQGQGTYDFFMNPSKPPRKNPLNNSSFIAKLVVLVGGAVALLIILAIVASFFNQSNKQNQKDLTTIAQQQQEMVRVSNSASSYTKNSSTRFFDINLKLTVASDQAALLSFLSKNGVTLKTKQLDLLQSSVTDQKLSTANQASRYDEVFVKIMQKQLQTYMGTLKKTYNEAKNTTEKKLLNNDYKHATLLLKQSKVH